MNSETKKHYYVKHSSIKFTPKQASFKMYKNSVYYNFLTQKTKRNQNLKWEIELGYQTKREKLSKIVSTDRSFELSKSTGKEYDTIYQIWNLPERSFIKKTELPMNRRRKVFFWVSNLSQSIFDHHSYLIIVCSWR